MKVSKDGWGYDPKSVRKEKGFAAGRAVRKAQIARELGGWNDKYIPMDSEAEAEHVAKLKRQMNRCAYKFSQYGLDMKEWTDKDMVSEQVKELSWSYQQNMIDLCLQPLSNGVSPATVMDTLGIYIGMNLTSKNFRQACNTRVAAALSPLASRLVNTGATVGDWVADGTAKVLGFADRVSMKTTGHKIGATQAMQRKLWGRERFSVKAEATLESLQDRALRAQNDGRVPLTPESAAVTYLAFCNQAYQAMREPDADASQISKQFASASEKLYDMALKDGISRDQLNVNIRTIAGLMCHENGYCAGTFEELGYETLETAPMQERTGPDGIKYRCWAGEFLDKEGYAFEGAFTPRIPRTKRELEAAMGDFISGCFENCSTMEQVLQVSQDPAYIAGVKHFENMFLDDAMVMANHGDETDERSLEEIYNGCVQQAGMAWGDKHPEEFERYCEKWKAEQEATRARRGAWYAGDEEEPKAPEGGHDEYGG